VKFAIRPTWRSGSRISPIVFPPPAAPPYMQMSAGFEETRSEVRTDLTSRRFSSPLLRETEGSNSVPSNGKSSTNLRALRKKDFCTLDRHKNYATHESRADVDHAGRGDGLARSMTMLPKPSRAASAPGGTTEVASYSSTMQGPRRAPARSERANTGTSIQPRCAPK